MSTIRYPANTVDEHNPQWRHSDGCDGQCGLTAPVGTPTGHGECGQTAETRRLAQGIETTPLDPIRSG